MTAFELNAELRQNVGKSASRCLRHSHKIPAIIYGAGKPPVALIIDHEKAFHASQHEAFYSHLLTINVNGEEEKVVLKALQRHPFKPKLLHMDFLRVSAKEKLRMHVPLHFTGAEIAPGVKQNGGIISHAMNDVEITCLPEHLPEFINVDISHLGLNQAIHLSNLQLPEGVELTHALKSGSENDPTVVSVHLPRASAEKTTEASATTESNATK